MAELECLLNFESTFNPSLTPAWLSSSLVVLNLSEMSFTKSPCPGSKSANYCCSNASGGTALLLLCEAELGEPMQILTNASYNAGEDAKEKGLLST